MRAFQNVSAPLTPRHMKVAINGSTRCSSSALPGPPPLALQMADCRELGSSSPMRRAPVANLLAPNVYPDWADIQATASA